MNLKVCNLQELFKILKLYKLVPDSQIYDNIYQAFPN